MDANNPGLSLKGNYLPRIPGGADLATTQNAVNDVINRLNDMLQSQVFSDGTNKRMIIGYQKDGWGVGKSFGIKVSIEGVDVTQATDDQLLFRMDLETWTYYDAATNKKVMDIGKLADGRTGIDWFDPSTLKNFMRAGVLPDNTGGTAVTKPGFNISDAF